MVRGAEPDVGAAVSVAVSGTECWGSCAIAPVARLIALVATSMHWSCTDGEMLGFCTVFNKSNAACNRAAMLESVMPLNIYNL